MVVEHASGDAQRAGPLFEPRGGETADLEFARTFVVEGGLEFEGFGQEGVDLVRPLVTRASARPKRLATIAIGAAGLSGGATASLAW